MSSSNNLSEAQEERLYLLAEEMGEAIQSIGKILRHGYSSRHPEGGVDNKENLEIELGDVLFSMDLLHMRKDIDKSEVVRWANIKSKNVKPYLHHQGDDV